jgi:hypothetical protein
MALAMRKVCPAVDLLFHVKVVFILLFLFSSFAFSQQSYTSTFTWTYNYQSRTTGVAGISVYGYFSCDSISCGDGVLVGRDWYGCDDSIYGTEFQLVSKPFGYGNRHLLRNSYNCRILGETSWSCPPAAIGQPGGYGHLFGTATVHCDLDFLGIPPCANPAPTDSAAQALLAAKRAQCDSLGGEYVGSVVQQNGNYCVEGECKAKHIGECPSDSGGINMLPKRFSRRQLYDEDSQMCREPPAEALRQKSGYYYNVKGQRLGSLTAGKPKARTPLYAREMLRGTMVEEAVDYWYRNDSPLRDFLARVVSSDSCGIKGKGYGIIKVENGDTIRVGGNTCSMAQIKTSFDIPLLPEIDNEICGAGQDMYKLDRLALNVSLLDTIPPQIRVVDTNDVFPGGKKLKQEEIDEIWKHELGHKRDMECIAQKFPTRKVMFDGCFCTDSLKSLVKQEFDKDSTAYNNMLHMTDSIYHLIYDFDGYPEEEDMYDCPYYTDYTD